MPRAFDRQALPLDRSPLRQLAEDVGRQKDAKTLADAAGRRNANGIVDTIRLHRRNRIDDLRELLSGAEDGDTTDMGTRWLEQRYKTQATINGIVNSLFGWVEDIDWTPDDSARAQADLATTIAAVGATVAALQNNRNNSEQGGRSAFVDFTSREPSTTLGADFAQIYTLGGDAQLGIGNGAELQVGSSFAPRYCRFHYLPTVSATSYQRIGIVFGSSPEGAARNEIHGRINVGIPGVADHSRYVNASMEKYRATLSCVVDGFETVWKTRGGGLFSDFSFKANAVYWLELGSFFVGALNLRTYRLLEGDRPILTHQEIGATSYEGESYRGAGGAVYADADGRRTKRPARMAAFAWSDNQPPTLSGSYAEVARLSGAMGGVVSDGVRMLPPGWWDTVRATTADFEIARDDAGRIIGIRIVNDGQYRAQMQAKTGISYSAQIIWVVYVNGQPTRWVGNAAPRGVDIFGGNEQPIGLGANVVIPLQAGDLIQWGYESKGDSPGMLVGESTGNRTYFNIALQQNKSST